MAKLPATEASYVYELRSINLQNLPKAEQASVLDRFIAFLNALTEPVTIKVVRDRRTAAALGAVYEGPYIRFFIEADSQIDSLISMLGTKFVRVPSAPGIGLLHTGPRYIIDAEQRFVQVYNVTRLGGSTPPAFLTALYPFIHSVSVEIAPTDVYDAKKLALRHARSVGNRLMLRQLEGRSLDPDEQVEYERADGASKLIARGVERLFKVRTKVVLRESSYEELVATRKKLKQVLGGVVGEIDSPEYLQEPLLTGKGPSWATGRWLYTTTSGVSLFFPFAGLDIMDPTGVLLGQNLQTGNVIIYDLYEKEGYDISILGTKGYGKSTFVKSYLARMAEAYPDMMIFLFDSIVKPEYGVGPDGKHESSFAGLTGCIVHRFDREKGAGLDPFAVFPDKRRAANFIASLAKVEDEPDLLADLYITAEKSSNIDELVANSPDKLHKRLTANLPPYMFLFKGEMELYPRMVFVLYDIPPGEMRDAAAFLTLSAIWKKIQELPVSTKKALVIDEGWALVETNPRTGKPFFPMAVEYVPEIVSTCRHYNTAFVFATQLVSDLMGRGGVYGPGRRIIENASTKIVLHQDQAASDTLREAFNLGGSETRFVTNAKVGQGLLIAQEGHVPFYNFLSDTELKYFTTRPKEVTA